MFTDRDGNLTDDADRWLSGHERTFDCGDVPDFDGMEYDDLHSDFKCASTGADGQRFPCCCDWEGKFVGPGCKHCNPVDHEAKPYGWGLERFECNEAYRVLREVSSHASLGLCRSINLRTACAWVGFNFHVEGCSDRVWDRLCETCETHTEAVEKYTRWAKKVAAHTGSVR